MKENTYQHIRTASCSAQPEHAMGVAACTFEINIDQPWQQILPGQAFAAYDGRPKEVPGNKWLINDESGQALAASLSANADKGRPLLFDYEHQTRKTANNGQPAPASAWGEKFEWRPGKGLFAQLSFTPKAREMIKNGEYRYYSPVLFYNDQTGDVIGLHSVALTNDPAIQGMQPAAALKNQSTDPTQTQQEQHMNPILAALFAALSLDAQVDANSDISAAALHARLTSEDGKKAVADLTAKLEEAEESETKIAALKAASGSGGGAPDPTKFVPVAVYNAVLGQVAELKADNEQLTTEQLIEQAKADGALVLDAELPYLKSMATADLKAALDARPKVAALTGEKQTSQNNKPADTPASAELSADLKGIAQQLGIEQSEFAKLHAADK